METVVLYLIFLILVIGMVYGAHKEFSNRKFTNIPFKEAMDLINLPVATFEHNGNKLHLMLDTGSDDSYINVSSTDLLSPVRVDNVNIPVVTGSGESKAQGRVILDLVYNNNRFLNNFFIMDLNTAFKAITEERGIEIHGIIGNQFLKKYEYKLDFESMVAQSKKGVKL